jgi:hypothetical protein
MVGAIGATPPIVIDSDDALFRLRTFGHPCCCDGGIAFPDTIHRGWGMVVFRDTDTTQMSV